MTDVVLCNFGGPTAAAEVEPFLQRLFEDPFIIRSPWLGPSSRAFIGKRIAKKRAASVTQEYEKIGYSPINRMTDAQARHLEERLKRIRPETRVHVCNRYTEPFADDVVRQLRPDERRIFVLSLYPHLCHSTTVSSYRDFDLAVERHHHRRDVPSVRIFSWWHNPKALDYYERQLVDGLREAIQRHPTGHIAVVFSAHGIPARYDLRGDPYVNETRAHFAELRRRAGVWLGTHDGGRHLGRLSWDLSFQSRVGPVEWVRPYTDETIRELGKSRGGCLLMVPISFTADHIETLFEMDHTYKDLALASGFASYLRVTPANDDPALADCLVDVLLQHGY